MTRRISVLTLILSLSGIVVGCGSGKDDSPADVKPRAKVEIALARLGNIDNTVSTTGSFQVLRDEHSLNLSGNGGFHFFVAEDLE